MQVEAILVRNRSKRFIANATREAHLFLIAAFCRLAKSLSHSEQMGWLVGAVGIELKAALNRRKLLILLNEKTAKNTGIAQLRYTPGTPSKVSTYASQKIRWLQARIDGLAFKRENTEDTFMYPTKRFLPDESLQCFDSKSEFTECQGTLGGNRTTAQTLQVLGQQVFRPIDNSQVFRAAADRRGTAER